ncbi:DUF2087 domain-containing protein (plasmid) [Streptomyces sp. BI20]|uniref:DUF2087 domain-containing protein n=1 Tax=Streptomyces sp. BI20 TaxID=3403460 RepID=UPI003C74C6D7
MSADTTPPPATSPAAHASQDPSTTSAPHASQAPTVSPAEHVRQAPTVDQDPIAPSAPAATAAPHVSQAPTPSLAPSAAPSADAVVAQLAEPNRLRVHAALVLGADSPTAVAEATGLAPKEVAAALRRLRAAGLVTEDAGRITPVPDLFRDLVKAERARRAEEAPAEDHGHAQDDPRTESLLRTFVRDGRLLSLPGQWSRREVVLRHLAHRTFEAGAEYDEASVNAHLARWCEGSDTDHVTVRRYLVDLRLLGRDAGRYRLRTDAHPPLAA